MDFNQIQELIKLVGKTKISEFILKEGDYKIVIRNQHGGNAEMVVAPQVMMPAAPQMLAPAPAPVAAEKPTAPPPPPAPDAAGNLLTIKSPMIGTFYRAPNPEKPTYVKPGDSISAGTVVCMIEAMKLFNEIESEISGKIVKVLVENGSPVEYDQPMFLVEPA